MILSQVTAALRAVSMRFGKWKGRMAATFLFLFLFAAAELFGHGRIHTTVAAGVWEDRATVQINAALVDLIVIGDLDFETIAALPPDERIERLNSPLTKLVERFWLIDERDGPLTPQSVRFDFPDEPDDDIFQRGIDQRHYTVHLEYRLSSPPAWLIFWQSFGYGETAALYPTGHYHSPHETHEFLENGSGPIPIYTALTVRQAGELALLPSELGTGFPVKQFFSWEEDFVPLAHRSSLRGATPAWENRPASSRLTVAENRIGWTVYLPLEMLVEAGVEEARDRDDWEALRDRLAASAALEIDGERRGPDDLALSVHPMSAMALVHNRPMPPEGGRPGIVVLDLGWELSKPPNRIEALWTLYASSLPSLYCEVLEAGRVTGPFVLNEKSPSLRRPPVIP